MVQIMPETSEKLYETMKEWLETRKKSFVPHLQHEDSYQRLIACSSYRVLLDTINFLEETMED